MQKVTDDIYLLVISGMVSTLLLSAVIIYFYMRYHKKFTVQREEMQRAELSYQVKLLHATIQSQEDERKRIGQDMHDDVCGSLSNLRMVISKLDPPGAEDPVRGAVIKKSQLIIDGLITKVRDISHALSPSGLEVFGFADTLETLCDDIRESSGLQINIQNDTGASLKKMDINTSLAMYRVMQELLANTLKHSQAQHVDISMHTTAGAIELSYRDDGRGFDPAEVKHNGIGMHNIKSRIEMIKASFTINTAPGNGFGLNILLPVSS